MGCVQPGADFDKIIDKSYFSSDSSITSRLASALNLGSGSSKSSGGTHSFSIIAQVQKDPDLAPESLQLNPKSPIPVHEVLAKQGDKIRAYAEKWAVDPTNKEDLMAKIEELAYFVTILYGVAGLQGKDFRANFYSFVPLFLDK